MLEMFFVFLHNFVTAYFVHKQCSNIYDRCNNSWIEVEEILENETSNSETKSRVTETKRRRQLKDSLMKLNVLKHIVYAREFWMRTRSPMKTPMIPSMLTTIKTLTRNMLQYKNNPLITQSLLKICSKEISMNHIYSLEARWLTWYIVVGTVHDVAEDM